MSSVVLASKLRYLLCSINAMAIQAVNLPAKARKQKVRGGLLMAKAQYFIPDPLFVCFVGSFTCGAFGSPALKAQFSFSRLFKY